MSILNTLHRMGALMRASLFHKLDPARSIAFSFTRFSDNTAEESAIKNEDTNADAAKIARQPIIPVETSIKYMNTDAYKQTYGDDPVWKPYRRNHKGAIPPRRTRRTCIRGGVISTGNPCPICRDEYLVIDYKNIQLLKQFIDEHNGSILSYSKTGICQRRYKQLLVAFTKAKDYGTIIFDVPRRQYDYAEWKPANN